MCAPSDCFHHLHYNSKEDMVMEIDGILYQLEDWSWNGTGMYIDIVEHVGMMFAVDDARQARGWLSQQFINMERHHNFKWNDPGKVIAGFARNTKNNDAPWEEDDFWWQVVDNVVAVLRNHSVSFAKRSHLVEEKFHKGNFRSFSEMQILAKIRLEIFDFVEYVQKFW